MWSLHVRIILFPLDAEMDSKKSVPARESFRDYALGKRKREVEEESSKFGGLLKRVLVSASIAVI